MLQLPCPVSAGFWQYPFVHSVEQQSVSSVQTSPELLQEPPVIQRLLSPKSSQASEQHSLSTVQTSPATKHANAPPLQVPPLPQLLVQQSALAAHVSPREAQTAPVVEVVH
jgi:hypothetical protein